MALPLQPSFDDLSTPLYEVTFCILDLETTGGSARNCEITEVGAIKSTGGVETASFQTLVDPGAEIPPSITLLTGITHAMVVDAPDIHTVLPGFLEFIGDAVIVGHNVRFDMSFLNAAADRLGYDRLPNSTVDTAALARRLVRNEVRNLKLQSLAAHFRSPVTPNHRALEDARATAHVLHGLLERAGSLGVTNIDDLLALPRARGSSFYRKINLTEGLPRSPGVYMFRDRHDRIIYVGKASNLRQRVRQYFYGDTRKSITNLMREMQAIDHQVCPTALEAAVTELRLIHTHLPRHNRRSRPPKSSHFVRLTDEQFPRLSVVRTVKNKALAHIGPFRSRRAAVAVMEAVWDAVPIRRCTGRPGRRPGTCAPAQLGVALCPCDGLLPAGEYGAVIDVVMRAFQGEPDLLLTPLEERMTRHASSQRFEEAGWVRDRHRALARAFEQRNRWNCLQEAGTMEATNSAGETALIDHGLLVATWARQEGRPLLPVPNTQAPVAEVAPSVLVSEEADLVWRWLVDTPTMVVDSTGPLSYPASRVRHLKTSGRT